MANGIAQKLRIKEGMILLSRKAPEDFKEKLEPLPADVTLSKTAKSFDQLHWFVKTVQELQEGLPTILSELKDGAICWIYFPKGSSGIQTDLNRDRGWEAVQQLNVQWLSLISFDAIWSAFAIRQKTAADTKKAAAKPAQREIYQYADSVTKTIRLPEDLAKALQKNQSEAKTFEALSFSNRREFVEWVISAKRPETRATRVKETIERLAKGWKNPANR